MSRIMIDRKGQGDSHALIFRAKKLRSLLPSIFLMGLEKLGVQRKFSPK